MCRACLFNRALGFIRFLCLAFLSKGSAVAKKKVLIKFHRCWILEFRPMPDPAYLNLSSSLKSMDQVQLRFRSNPAFLQPFFLKKLAKLFSLKRKKIKINRIWFQYEKYQPISKVSVFDRYKASK